MKLAIGYNPHRSKHHVNLVLHDGRQIKVRKNDLEKTHLNGVFELKEGAEVRIIVNSARPQNIQLQISVWVPDDIVPPLHPESLIGGD